MKNLTRLIFPAVIVLLAVFIVRFFENDSANQPAFVASSTGEHGASLLYDTLRHMGYPVRVSRSRLTSGTRSDLAYIIIQPTYPPHFSAEEIDEKMAWVYSGGLLIFLQHAPRPAINWPITRPPTLFGTLNIHEIGDGMLVTGSAREIANSNMMEYYETGMYIHAILRHWEPGGIMFGEYYHGPRPTQNMFAHFPAVVRLVVVQLLVLGVIIIWYLGKRFGNPVVFYEEHERDENEHIHALTRLYMKVKRK